MSFPLFLYSPFAPDWMGGAQAGFLGTDGRNPFILSEDCAAGFGGAYSSNGRHWTSDVPRRRGAAMRHAELHPIHQRQY